MKRTALLIDGGHLRTASTNAGIFCEPNFIQDFAHLCFDREIEDPYRILYYDCPSYSGKQRYPISGDEFEIKPSNAWLKRLACKELFAVRLGETQWRGWKLKSETIYRLSRKDSNISNPLCDNDFCYDVVQKGVDMKIGLDIAVLADNEFVSNLIIVTADNDIIPAIKHGRKEGMQIILAILPGEGRGDMDKLREHADFIRNVPWPEKFTPFRQRSK